MGKEILYVKKISSIFKEVGISETDQLVHIYIKYERIKFLITINSFIKKDNRAIDSAYNIEEYFILFDHVNILKYIEDYDYIEGAILFEYNGTDLLGFKYWDLIDQLWSYIIDSLRGLMLGKKRVSFYLPDQPVEIEMECISQGKVLITIDRRKYFFDKRELFVELCKGAQQFWELLGKCSLELIEIQSQSELEKIQQILKLL